MSWDSGEASSASWESELSYSSTNGYFNPREHPQDLYIESQTTPDASAPKSSNLGSDTPWLATQFLTMGDTNLEATGKTKHSRRDYGSSQDQLKSRFGSFFACIKTVTMVGIFAILSWMVVHTRPVGWIALPLSNNAERVSIPGNSIFGAAPAQGGVVQSESTKNIPPTDYLQADDRHPDCPVKSHFSKSYEFSELKDFTLRNLIVPVHRLRLYGSIHVLPAPASQVEGIKVNFTFDTSDLALQDLLEVEEADSSLVIRFPTTQPAPDTGWECIATRTNVYVRPGLSLSNFHLESRVSGIHVPAPMDFKVTNATILSLTAGAVGAEPLFQSRRTFVDVDAGSVYGQYPIYDLLSVRTHAGSIAIDVIPKPANEKYVQPADFVAHSAAGSIRVDYPPLGTDIPERDYRADVQSSVGSISGRFLHGTNTTMRTQMGDVRVDILPYSADAYDSTLNTQNQMGTQVVTVLQPYAGTALFSRLKSKHLSDVGGIKIVYPRAWQGTVKAESGMGTVTVAGPGVEIVRKGKKGVVGMFVEAKKGEGQGNAEVRTDRGSLDFVVSR